jgi:hypothetical protein
MQLNKIVSFLPGFTGTAISGVNASQSVLHGRPYGGCAVLWRDKLNQYIIPYNFKSVSQRVCGCILSTESETILLLCVYFPTDSYNENCTANLDIVLGDIEYAIENAQCNQLIIGGDINCDFIRRTPFVNKIQMFLKSLNLNTIWNTFPTDFTHVHTDNVSTSIIDHFLVSANIHVVNASTVHHIDNVSRHSAITMRVSNIMLKETFVCSSVVDPEQTLPRIAWYKSSKNDIDIYQNKLNTILQQIEKPIFLNDCHNLCCNDDEHRATIDAYCVNVIRAIEDASSHIPLISPGVEKHRIPGWNTYVKPFRDEALYWHKLWTQHGKPRAGVIANTMRSSRRDYHYAIRHVRRQQNQFKKESFLQALLTGERQFHKEVKKYKGVKSRFANSVNGEQGNKNIAEVFAKEYKDLFNSCSYDQNFVHNFMQNLNTNIRDEGRLTHFSDSDIHKAIKHIKFLKADGVFNLMSDHFKYATNALYEHIAFILNTCMLHGYIPHCLLLSSLIPIPKNQLGDVTNSQNYRGIALCALCLKIFEYAILLKHERVFLSSHHQFAYKAKSSTTMCTWTAREVISYYKNNGSEIFACLLDCSKAFDKIRYDILFNKLLQRGVPPIIIRFILYCYTNSQVKVRWNGAESDPFTVENGVRQGAVLSPFLFNMYVDELINDLTDDGSGCWVGHMYYGVLIYADDILLLAPTITSLQRMIKICEKFGSDVGLTFNSQKTVCINFHRDGKCSQNMSPPNVYLNGQPLQWQNQVKHLGHILSCCLSCNADISAKKGSFISCVNNIQTEFGFAHPSTKSKLLQIYGTSFYGSNLWNLYDTSASHLFKTWNIALRKLYALPYRTHTKFLDHICNIRHISVTLKVRFVSFIQSLLQSSNAIIKHLIHFYTFNHTSPTGLLLSQILNEFDIGYLSDMPLFTSDPRTSIIEKYNMINELSVEELSYCSAIKELIDCKHGTSVCGLRNDECMELIDYLSTD